LDSAIFELTEERKWLLVLELASNEVRLHEEAN